MFVFLFFFSCLGKFGARSSIASSAGFCSTLNVLDWRGVGEDGCGLRYQYGDLDRELCRF